MGARDHAVAGYFPRGLEGSGDSKAVEAAADLLRSFEARGLEATQTPSQDFTVALDAQTDDMDGFFRPCYRYLYAGNQPNVGFEGGSLRLVQARGGVVISKCENGHARGRGPANQFGRRVGAVRGGGMGVKIVQWQANGLNLERPALYSICGHRFSALPAKESASLAVSIPLGVFRTLRKLDGQASSGSERQIPRATLRGSLAV